jgi:YHS domain-containing protein
MRAHDEQVPPSRRVNPSEMSPALRTSQRDAVCGMSVDTSNAKWHADHDRAEYFFCSSPCRRCCIAEPAQFLRPNADTAPATFTAPNTPELLLRPMIASAAMSRSSVSVIGNALRLRRARLAS